MALYKKIVVAPETDIIGQVLGQETAIKGQRCFMGNFHLAYSSISHSNTFVRFKTFKYKIYGNIKNSIPSCLINKYKSLKCPMKGLVQIH